MFPKMLNAAWSCWSSMSKSRFDKDKKQESLLNEKARELIAREKMSRKNYHKEKIIVSYLELVALFQHE